MLRTIAKVMCAVLGSLSLGACMAPLVINQPLQPTAPTDGAVVMRLSPSWWWVVTVVQEKDENGTALPYPYSYRLGATGWDYVNGRLYAGALPAGTYSIAKLSADRVYIEPTKARLGTFTVKPGRIAYLGNLLQLNAPDSGGRGRFILAHPGETVDFDEGKQLVEAHFPDLAPLAGQPMTGWDRETYDRLAMHERYQFIRANAYANFSPLDLGKEGVLFGTQAGVIKRVRRGQRPELINLATPHAVIALARLPDGTLLAAGEQRLFKFSRDGGKTWKNVSHDMPFGTLTTLQPLPDGTVYAVHTREGDVTVFKGRIDRPAWKAVLSESLSGKRVAPRSSYDLYAQAHLAGSTLLVLVPDTQLFALDTRTDQAVLRKLPGVAHGLALGKDGRLFCQCGGEFQGGNYVSADNGATWTRMTVPPGVSLPVFRDAQNGIVNERRYSGSPKLYTTSDGGATWTKQGNGPRGTLLGFSADGSLLFSQDTYGKLFYSEDNAATWEAVETIN